MHPFLKHKGLALNIVEVLHCSTFTVTLAAESTCVLNATQLFQSCFGCTQKKRTIWDLKNKTEELIWPKQGPGCGIKKSRIQGRTNIV